MHHIHRFVHGTVPVVALFQQAAILQLIHRPKNGSEQEGYRHRLILGDPRIGIGECNTHQALCILRIDGVRMLEHMAGIGKEHRKQPITLQHFKTRLAITAHKQLLRLIKKTRGGYGTQIVAAIGNRRFRRRFQRHTARSIRTGSSV